MRLILTDYAAKQQIAALLDVHPDDIREITVDIGGNDSDEQSSEHRRETTPQQG